MPTVLISCLVGLTLLGAGGSSAAYAQSVDLDTQLNAAFRATYNLDADVALGHARAAVAAAPNESRAHRAVASVLWMQIIFRRGAVTLDHYLGGLGQPEHLPKPQPELVAEFKKELALAIDLAARRLQVNADDVQARFDLGSAYGLQASYAVSVENSMTSALSSARRAFDAQETVLARDPRRVGAGVIVGTYRYMVSALALPSRMIAYMVGFGGDKEKAISLLQTAARNADSVVEAKMSLVMIYSREERYADAYQLLGELAAEFPRNRLFVLEQGSAAIRAAKYAEADAVLSRGLDALAHETRPKFPGEQALWLYKRGLARFHMDRRDEATADLKMAVSQEPFDWVKARAELTLGKLADLSGRRDDAVAAYRQSRETALRAKDSTAAAEAARLTRRPFTRPRQTGMASGKPIPHASFIGPAIVRRIGL